MTPSIAQRLTLSVGVIAVVVFTVVGTLLYLALERELMRRESEELAGRMNFVRHLLTEVPNLSSAEGLTHHVDDMVASHGNLYAWITAVDGTTVYGGKPPVIPDINAGGPFPLVAGDGVPARALVERLAPTGKLPSLQVVVAMDARPTQRVLAGFGLALTLVCLGGVAAMLLLGAWVARRGLAPIHALSDQAQAIGPQALSQRLPEQGIPAELLALAQSFNRVLDRLEQSYRQLEAFNADVAHELRTPLTNLIGTTEVALSRGRGVHELRDVLESNLEELARVKTIVNDMLFVARADRGERAAAGSVSLGQVVSDVAEFLDPVLEERRITLETHGQATAIGDVGLLRRAVTNLLSNALAHTESGNTIRVAIVTEANWVSLHVRNPGPEIRAENLPHIFDRFYRADAARRGREEGHGLGLAIVKAIVQMHAGEVFAKSTDGVTDVGFRLPQGG